MIISINLDAQSIGQIDNIRSAVSAARKGGLTKDMMWNALPLERINQWLESKKKELTL